MPSAPPSPPCSTAAASASLHLDRAGRLLAANVPALDILQRGDGLSDKGGTLSAWLPEDHERLQDLLARALPRLWGQPPGGGSMTLRRLSDPAPLGLHISPVGDARADFFGGRRVAALVLVVDPAFAPRIDPVRIAQVLGLRPSEARVAALLAEGRSVREIAEATDRRPGYVRKVLKRVYGEAGGSQARWPWCRASSPWTPCPGADGPHRLPSMLPLLAVLPWGLIRDPFCRFHLLYGQRHFSWRHRTHSGGHVDAGNQLDLDIGKTGCIVA